MPSIAVSYRFSCRVYLADLGLLINGLCGFHKVLYRFLTFLFQTPRQLVKSFKMASEYPFTTGLSQWAEDAGLHYC